MSWFSRKLDEANEGLVGIRDAVLPPGNPVRNFLEKQPTPSQVEAQVVNWSQKRIEACMMVFDATYVPSEYRETVGETTMRAKENWERSHPGQSFDTLPKEEKHRVVFKQVKADGKQYDAAFRDITRTIEPIADYTDCVIAVFDNTYTPSKHRETVQQTRGRASQNYDWDHPGQPSFSELPKEQQDRLVIQQVQKDGAEYQKIFKDIEKKMVTGAKLVANYVAPGVGGIIIDTAMTAADRNEILKAYPDGSRSADIGSANPAAYLLLDAGQKSLRGDTEGAKKALGEIKTENLVDLAFDIAGAKGGGKGPRVDSRAFKDILARGSKAEIEAATKQALRAGQRELLSDARHAFVDDFLKKEAGKAIMKTAVKQAIKKGGTALKEQLARQYPTLGEAGVGDVSGRRMAELAFLEAHPDVRAEFDQAVKDGKKKPTELAEFLRDRKPPMEVPPITDTAEKLFERTDATNEYVAAQTALLKAETGQEPTAQDIEKITKDAKGLTNDQLEKKTAEAKLVKAQIDEKVLMSNGAFKVGSPEGKAQIADLKKAAEAMSKDDLDNNTALVNEKLELAVKRAQFVQGKISLEKVANQAFDPSSEAGVAKVREWSRQADGMGAAQLDTENARMAETLNRPLGVVTPTAPQPSIGATIDRVQERVTGIPSARETDARLNKIWDERLEKAQKDMEAAIARGDTASAKDNAIMVREALTYKLNHNSTEAEKPELRNRLEATVKYLDSNGIRTIPTPEPVAVAPQPEAQITPPPAPQPAAQPAPQPEVRPEQPTYTQEALERQEFERAKAQMEAVMKEANKPDSKYIKNGTVDRAMLKADLERPKATVDAYIAKQLGKDPQGTNPETAQWRQAQRESQMIQDYVDGRAGTGPAVSAPATQPQTQPQPQQRFEGPVGELLELLNGLLTTLKKIMGVDSPAAGRETAAPVTGTEPPIGRTPGRQSQVPNSDLLTDMELDAAEYEMLTREIRERVERENPTLGTEAKTQLAAAEVAKVDQKIAEERAAHPEERPIDVSHRVRDEAIRKEHDGNARARGVQVERQPEARPVPVPQPQPQARTQPQPHHEAHHGHRPTRGTHMRDAFRQMENRNGGNYRENRAELRKLQQAVLEKVRADNPGMDPVDLRLEANMQLNAALQVARAERRENPNVSAVDAMRHAREKVEAGVDIIAEAQAVKKGGRTSPPVAGPQQPEQPQPEQPQPAQTQPAQRQNPTQAMNAELEKLKAEITKEVAHDNKDMPADRQAALVRQKVYEVKVMADQNTRTGKKPAGVDYVKEKTDNARIRNEANDLHDKDKDLRTQLKTALEEQVKVEGRITKPDEFAREVDNRMKATLDDIGRKSAGSFDKSVALLKEAVEGIRKSTQGMKALKDLERTGRAVVNGLEQTGRDLLDTADRTGKAVVDGLGGAGSFDKAKKAVMDMADELKKALGPKAVIMSDVDRRDTGRFTPDALAKSDGPSKGGNSVA